MSETTQQIWVKTKRGVAGPFSPTQIRQLAAEGRLKADHLISTDQEKWTRACKVKGLQFPGEEQAARTADVPEEQVAEGVGEPANARESRSKPGVTEQQGIGPVCDICNALGVGTRVTSDEMRAAVFENGFDPFALGLVGRPMQAMGMGDDFEMWKSGTVAQTTSDWNICAGCMEKLSNYLPSPRRALVAGHEEETMEDTEVAGGQIQGPSHGDPSTAPGASGAAEPSVNAEERHRTTDRSVIEKRTNHIIERFEKQLSAVSLRAMGWGGLVMIGLLIVLIVAGIVSGYLGIKGIFLALIGGLCLWLVGGAVLCAVVGSRLAKRAREEFDEHFPPNSRERVIAMESICRLRLQSGGGLEMLCDRFADEPAMPPELGYLFDHQPRADQLRVLRRALQALEARRSRLEAAGHGDFVQLCVERAGEHLSMSEDAARLLDKLARKSGGLNSARQIRLAVTIILAICQAVDEAPAVEQIDLRITIYAPDVREFLDPEGFKRCMQRRLISIERLVTGVLENPSCVNEDAVRETVSNPTGKADIAQLGRGDPRVLRIQATQVVCKVISEQLKSIISARMKRAGEIMIRYAGNQVDIGTLLEACIQQANSEMTSQWARFYAVYAVLGGALMKIVKSWEWEEAIDTLMGWPGELRPALGLAAFLQGYWADEQGQNGVSPKVLAGRVMCWVYCYPDRWETVKRTMEMAGVHEAALRQGKIALQALTQQWREFAAEIARHAELLKQREEHKGEAEATLKHCKKV